MSSFVFLLSLFYFRFIPISIFWTIYLPFSDKLSRKIYREVIAVCLIILSYSATLAIVAVIPITILNYFFQDSNEGILAPILLFVPEKEWNLSGTVPFKNYFFSFLLNSIFCSERKILLTKTLATGLEVISLVLIILGGIEVFNDYNSHLNPDIFDFLFPEYGALMFWGGIFVLTVAYFFLAFLIPGLSVKKWKKRLALSADLPPFIKEFVFSRSLFHPNFYLTPSGRLIVKNNTEAIEDLPLLLEKAFIKNKDRIPENWVD